MNRTLIYKIVVLWLSSLVLMLMATSCGSKDEPDIPPQPSREPVMRTVLVYMAACNSLGRGQYDIKDLNEMNIAIKSGAVDPDSRLVVFHADAQGNQSLVELTAQGCDTLKKYDSKQMSVSIDRMKEVFTDAKKGAPAQAYGLILWSHGNGWTQNGVTESQMPPMLRTWGEERGRSMNITSLEHALDGQGFDYVYFDCCYMASVEVAYQLRHVTPMIVGSAIELPTDGMPYHLTLAYLTRSTPDLVGAATTTFNHYNQLTGEDRTCAMSVISTSGLDRLAEVSHKVIQASGRKTPSGYMPQKFQVESTCRYFDLEHYYNALLQTVGDEELKQEWKDALNNCVIYKASTPMIWNRLSLDAHSGLSSYILQPTADPTTKGYNTLSWYSDVVEVQYLF